MTQENYLTINEAISKIDSGLGDSTGLVGAIAETPLGDLFDKMVISTYLPSDQDDFRYWVFNVELLEEFHLDIPFLEGFYLKFKEIGQVNYSYQEVEDSEYFFFFQVSLGRCFLQLPNKIFKPMVKGYSFPLGIIKQLESKIDQPELDKLSAVIESGELLPSYILEEFEIPKELKDILSDITSGIPDADEVEKTILSQALSQTSIVKSYMFPPELLEKLEGEIPQSALERLSNAIENGVLAQTAYSLGELGIPIALNDALSVITSKDDIKKIILFQALDWTEEKDEEGNLAYRDIEIDSGASISIDSDGNFEIILPFIDDFSPGISLKPVQIGDTGICIEASNVKLILAKEETGLSIESASLYLPKDLPAAPDLTISDCFISKNGFTGNVAADWDLLRLESETGEINFHGEIAGELFGFKGGLRRFAVDFSNNYPIASDIRGEMVIPYFEEAIEVRIHILNTGDFSITLLGVDEDGIVLTKEELLTLNVQSLTISKQGDMGSVIVNGGIIPLLMVSDGLEWPRLDVKELGIEQNLADFSDPPILRFKEAWLDLKDLATLDLWGFHFELNRIGMGHDKKTDKLWLDLTGSLRLIEQVPVGLAVEGFRITWPRLLHTSIDQLDFEDLLKIASKIEVRFAGVKLLYGIPKTVEFEGFIKFIKEGQTVGFAGDVALRMPATGFEAEAGLLVGMNFDGDPALPGIPLPYLYVYLGIELPSGIPLGQSGLALKGALGLFGFNVAPEKEQEQNWYYDWYKREPEGVQKATKWRFDKGSIAFGAGITITTSDGTLLGVRGLLAMVLPGPILMIEGKALMFDGVLPGEPPLKAMAVFDGPAKTMQLNIEAEAEVVEGVVEAYAMAEAFFDFKDLTNWHLYIGQDEPADRRVRANTLKLLKGWLFDANAYLMIDMLDADTQRSRMGVFINFTPPIPDLDPVKIVVNATLEGDGLLTISPTHFDGNLALSGTIGLSAFGMDMLIDAGADVRAETAKPSIIEGLVNVAVTFPSPTDVFKSLGSSIAPWVTAAVSIVPKIKPYVFRAEVPFYWEDLKPVQIPPPLELVSIDSTFAVADSSIKLDLNNATDDLEVLSTSPVVSLDGRPTLIFNQNMEQASSSPYPRSTDGIVKPYTIGPLVLSSSLEKITLHKKQKGRDSDWELVASSHPNLTNNEGILSGIWLADVGMEERRLRLWSDQPFMNVGTLTREGERSYTEMMLEAYPNYYKDVFSEENYKCVSFSNIKQKKAANSHYRLKYKSITFKGDPSAHIISGKHSDGTVFSSLELMAGGFSSVKICFPEPVCKVVIKFFSVKFDKNEVKKDMLEQSINGVELTDKKWEIPYQGKGFTSFDIDNIHMSIEEICYLTVAERERSIRARGQVILNEKIFSETGSASRFPVFEPGYFYKLEVSTLTKGALDSSFNDLKAKSSFYIDETLEKENGFNDISSPPSDPGEARAHDHQRTDRVTTYFQTDNPPNELSHYIKWSYPAIQDKRIFCDDDFSMCFRRDYLAKMFKKDSPFELEARVVNISSGVIESGYEVIWRKSSSTTFLPEEKKWLEHRGAELVEQPKDDIIQIKTSSATSSLLKNERHELILTGSTGGELLFSNSLNDPQTTPEEWVVKNKALYRKDDTQDASYRVGNEQWHNIDITIKIRSENSPSHAYINFYENNVVFPGEKFPISQHYQLYISFRSGGQASLELLHVIPNKQKKWLILSRIENIALNTWNYFHIRALYDEVKVWANRALALSYRLSDFESLEKLPVLSQGKVSINTSSSNIGFRNLSIRSTDLYRIPFMTSGFDSYTQLVKQAEKVNIKVSANPIFSSGGGAQVFWRRISMVNRNFSRVQLLYNKALVDHRDKLIDREALEKTKLELREVKAIMDERFSEVADELIPNLLYQPVTNRLRIYILEDDASSILGVWLKSPESLDVQLTIDDSKGIYIGRTAINASSNNVNARPLLTSDNTNVILLFTVPISNNSVELTFKHYHKLPENKSDGYDFRYEQATIYPTDNEEITVII